MKLPAPYLARRGKAGVSDRWYFKPSDRHRAAGWKVVRLHDEKGRPVADQLAAAAACRPLSDLYRRWLDGEANCTPDRIDDIGRLKPPKDAQERGEIIPPRRRRKKIVAGEKKYRPGTYGAIAADYLASRYFLKVRRRDGRAHDRPKSTQRIYQQCIAKLVKEHGDTMWFDLSRGAAKNWIEDLMDEAPAFGHSVYRTVRAMLAQTEFIYPDEWHPGHIKPEANPFAKLDIVTPEAEPMPWPINLVRPFVEAARLSGHRWLAAHILFNAWLGQRVGDMVAVPLNRFRPDRPLWIAQGKTGADVVLPWSMVPELEECARWLDGERKAFDKALAAKKKPIPTTWLIDETTGKPFTVDRIRNVYNEVRDKVCAVIGMTRIDGQPRWEADYVVKAYADDELALNVKQLQLRALRATSVTQLSNAGVSDIGAITGHAEDTLLKILKFYRARTSTRAANAFAMRLTFEGKQ